MFLWMVALLFLVRSSGIFLNNYAEMAFLKRYGVEYMPIVNMANAVATFFVMGVMTGFMTRFPGTRLLARLFVICGLSVAGIRTIIPFGIDLIYPALFMFKSQYEVLLALLFWNLANDLFNQARDLDDHLLEAVREEQDTNIRIGLIELLSDRAGPAAADAFSDLIETKTPALAMAMIDGGHRMPPEHVASLNRHIYDASSLPLDVKAHAVGSLFTVNQDKSGPVIDEWLASDDADLHRAGLITVGVCRDRRFTGRLKSFLSEPTEDDTILTLALESLRNINVTGLNPLVAEQVTTQAAPGDRDRGV